MPIPSPQENPDLYDDEDCRPGFGKPDTARDAFIARLREIMKKQDAAADLRDRKK